MTRTIKALAFSALLCATASFATSDNLLSMATDGAITTAKAEALSLNNDEMKQVAGGATWYNSYTGVGSRYFNSNTRAVYQPVSYSSGLYASTFGSYFWGRTYPSSRYSSSSYSYRYR